MLYSEYCITLPPSEFTKPSGKPSIFGSFRKEIARFSISSRWSARKDGGNRRERDGNSLGAYSPLAALGNLGSLWQWGSVAMGTCRFLWEWGVPPPNFGCLICLKMGTCWESRRIHGSWVNPMFRQIHESSGPNRRLFSLWAWTSKDHHCW